MRAILGKTVQAHIADVPQIEKVRYELAPSSAHKKIYFRLIMVEC